MLSGWTDIINSFAISQFSLRLNCYEMLTLYIDNCRLQGIPKSFHGNYPKNSSFIMGIQYLHELSLVFFLCWKLKPRPEEQIPCHSSFSDGIICGLHRGSNAVRGYFRSNLGIICGRGSFAALYSSQNNSLLERVDSRSQQIWRLRVMTSWIGIFFSRSQMRCLAVSDLIPSSWFNIALP